MNYLAFMVDYYLYTVSAVIGAYRVVKFDSLLNVEEIYYVKPMRNGGYSCDCWQHNTPTCRHREMMFLFKDTGVLNRGWFYHYESKTWEPPLSINPNSDAWVGWSP